MTIFIGADHRGFELKNKIIEYLHEKNIRIEDLGSYQLEPLDDNPDIGQKVAQAILQNTKEFLGIAVCGSGIGVSIAANRHKGIRCGLAFSKDQTIHGRQNDHINMIAIPSDYLDFEKSKEIIDVFIATPPILAEKYIRRAHKMDDPLLPH